MEVFRAVMLTGSMNGAAKLLYISQPAVSRLISYTEQSLGLRLFERNKGKLIPTSEAELLFNEVTTLYDEALRVDDFARDLAAQPQGALTLCLSPSLALNFIPPIVATYLRTHPNVRIRYHTTLLSEMGHELLGRKADLAVSVLPIENPNLIVEPIATGRMVCIMPERHPLTSRPSVSLKDLTAYPLILYNRNIPFGQLVAAAFQRAAVEWHAAVDILRAELACALVRAGVGIAIVDQFSVGNDDWPGICVRPLQETIPLTVSLVRSRFSKPSFQAREFIKILKLQTGRHRPATSGRADAKDQAIGTSPDTRRQAKLIAPGSR